MIVLQLGNAVMAAWLLAGWAGAQANQPGGAERLDQLLEQGRWEEAKVLADDLLEASPDDPRRLFQAGSIRVRLQAYQEALPLLEAAEKTHPPSAQLAGQLALCYRAAGQYDRFEQKMTEALQLDPDSAELNFLLGRHYGSLYDPARSIRFFSKVLDLLPGHPYSLYYRGYAHELSGDKEAARQDFLNSIRASGSEAPAFSAPHLGLARILLEEGRLREALEAAQEAVRRNPDEAQNWILAGKIQAKLDQAGAAVASFRRAAELDPDSRTAWYWLYRLYQLGGDREAADRALSRFRRLPEASP